MHILNRTRPRKHVRLYAEMNAKNNVCLPTSGVEIPLTTY